MSTSRSASTRRVVVAGIFILLLGAIVFWIAWQKFLAEGEQSFVDDVERFKYGSLNSELIAGIPYPIFMILPRVFPDLIDGHGGYGAFGLAWEEGQRLPIGLPIKRRGTDRVTMNCALCHTTSYRLHPEENPRFAIGGPSHTFALDDFLDFLFAAANDRRFTGNRMVPEMALHFDLSWLDLLLYKFMIIPATRQILLEAEKQLQWTESRPPWGPGRDDAFNLPKFVLLRISPDDTVGNTDFPALWRMGDREGHAMHWGGRGEGSPLGGRDIGLRRGLVAGFRLRRPQSLDRIVHGRARATTIPRRDRYGARRARSGDLLRGVRGVPCGGRRTRRPFDSGR